jgi:ZIP family zinc transporter
MIVFVLAAAGAGIGGGALARLWAPRVHARSAIQHFAAGLVIAAVASDLMPEILELGTTAGILGGFAGGGLAMIALKWGVLRLERRKRRAKPLPAGITAAAAVDTLIDGAIISAGFSVNQHVGGLLAVALALELAFLMLPVGVELRRASRWWTGVGITTGISLLLLVGAAASFFLAGVSEATLAMVLAAGAAALLYLVCEELLVESIQAEESLFSTAMLFAGFLTLLALELLTADRG